MKKTLKMLISAVFTAIFCMILASFVLPVKASAEEVHTPAGEVTFTWNYDRSGCTASYICGNCGQTVYQNCLVEISAEILPTCTERGTAKFVASVNINGAVYTKTIYQKDIAAKGHSFTNYKDNGDGTMTASCDHGCGAVDTITKSAIDTDKAVETETSCTEHDLEVVSYTWNSDNTACRAVLQCRNCGAVVSADCLVTMNAYTWPTAENYGTTEYAAAVTMNGQTWQEKLYRADIPYAGYAASHAAPEGTAYATAESVAEAKASVPVRVNPSGQEEKVAPSTDDQKKNSEDTKPEEETKEETEKESEEEISPSETESKEEETTAAESTAEETTEAETTAEETSETETEKETTAEETEESVTEREETETASTEEAASESTAASESETAAPEEKEEKTIPFWILYVIIGLVIVILILLIIIVVNKHKQDELRKKHEDVKKKIHDELK